MLKLSKIVITKNRMCRMTDMPGSCDIFDFDGNTIIVRIDDNECQLFSGFEIIKLSTEQKIIDSISLMGNNMIPTAIAVG